MTASGEEYKIGTKEWLLHKMSICENRYGMRRQAVHRKIAFVQAG